MSWVKEDFEDFQQQQQEQNQTQTWIARGNYFAALRSKIEEDVRSINEFWNSQPGSSKITVQPSNNGFQITKEILSFVCIDIQNGGDTLKIGVEVKKAVNIPGQITREELKVEFDGQRVFLTKGESAYFVPEQASKYILTPIIQSLKGKL